MIHRVVIVGPRYSGKTTMLRNIVRSNRGIRFQEFDGSVPDHVPNNMDFVATALDDDLVTILRFTSMGALRLDMNPRFHV